MPLILTETAKSLSEQTNIKINIIAEIEGFDLKFGTIDINRDLLFDDADQTFDSGLTFDGDIVDPQSRPWINLEGSTKNITSQLNLDKGIEAVRSFTLDVLDKDGELSTIFTPGHTVSDLLVQKAKIYLNLAGSTHPIDSLLIIEGIIGQYTFTGKGTCKIVVDHAAQLKRQEIFANHATELDGNINSAATTISVIDASGFLTPTTEFLTYVRIGDELIQYTGITNNDLTGCSREQLNTSSPAQHADDTEVTSFYRLQGNAIDLALKIMLSGGGYSLSKTVTAFNQITSSLFVQDAILFDVSDIGTEFGLVVGDHVQITGSSNNNITTTVKSVHKIDTTTSYIIVNSTLTTDTEETATVKFKSQYDVLVEGAGLLSSQLDVQSHLDIFDLFSGNFAPMDFYLDEPVKVDEFVNQQLYRPTNLYSVPGNKISVKMTLPPLSDIYTKTLNSGNVVNPNIINVNRSVNKYHFNTVVFKYDYDRLDLDKPKTGKIFLNNDSLTRIGAGKKVFKIESKGFRRNTLTSQNLDIAARRYLDRYKFAAESFSIEVFFSNIDIECGDVVIVDGVNIYDSDKGSRDFGPKLFEVINKSVSIGKSTIKLDLLSTSFGLDGRFGVVSPASKVGASATTTSIPLKSSYGFESEEYEKWESHIGATVRVHSNDWSYNETATITGFSETEENTMLIDGLSGAPLEDYIVDSSNYNDSTGSAATLLKDLYVYLNPTVPVASVANAKTFTVTSSFVSKLFVGAFVEVHKSDYTNKSEGKIASITSTGGSTETVVLEEDLSFTPASLDRIQLIGFSSDQGKPYRIL